MYFCIRTNFLTMKKVYAHVQSSWSSKSPFQRSRNTKNKTHMSFKMGQTAFPCSLMSKRCPRLRKGRDSRDIRVLAVKHVPMTSVVKKGQMRWWITYMNEILRTLFKSTFTRARWHSIARVRALGLFAAGSCLLLLADTQAIYCTRLGWRPGTYDAYGSIFFLRC